MLVAEDGAVVGGGHPSWSDTCGHWAGHPDTCCSPLYTLSSLCICPDYARVLSPGTRSELGLNNEASLHRQDINNTTGLAINLTAQLDRGGGTPLNTGLFPVPFIQMKISCNSHKSSFVPHFPNTPHYLLQYNQSFPFGRHEED